MNAPAPPESCGGGSSGGTGDGFDVEDAPVVAAAAYSSNDCLSPKGNQLVRHRCTDNLIIYRSHDLTHSQ